jgi:hypothetical protein
MARYRLLDSQTHALVLVIFRHLAGTPDMRTSGHAGTLEVAKRDFEASWHRRLKWAQLEEATTTHDVKSFSSQSVAHSPDVRNRTLDLELR